MSEASDELMGRAAQLHRQNLVAEAMSAYRERAARYADHLQELRDELAGLP